MQVKELVKPAHQRWAALILLLSWFIPFAGAVGCSILSTSPVLGGDKVTTEKQATKVVNKIEDQKVEKIGTTESGKDSVAEKTIQSNTAVDSSINNIKNSAGQVSPKSDSGWTSSNTKQDSSPSVPQDKQDNIDITLLARVIYAEARGEPIEGQVAVGAVLLNRLSNRNFPDNLWSIVFKKGEFCTVRDGQVWLQPDATAYRAARLAKAGWDPTYGALYFYNPGKTSSKWIWSRPVTTQIGSHLFAR